MLFKPHDTHTLFFNRDFVRTLNRETDLLIVGGGGLIHQLYGDWMFHLPDKLVHKVKVPIIIFGIGYNQFRGEPVPSAAILKNLKLLKDHAMGFSVRNDGTQDVLAGFGLAVDEIPDPGFFVDGPYPRPDIDGPYVVIQLANDMQEYRGFQLDEFTAKITQTICAIRKRGYKVVMAPHVKADIDLSKRVMALLEQPEDVVMWDFDTILRDEFNYLGLAYYKHAYCVLGMRGHSQICPIGMGVPVLTLGNHNKHAGLLQKLHLSTDYYVEANDPLMDRKLIEMFDQLVTERDNIKQLYVSQMTQLEARAAEYITGLRKKMDARPSNQAKDGSSRRIFQKVLRQCVSKCRGLVGHGG